QLDKLNKCKLTDEEFNKVLLFLDEGSIFDKAKKLRDHYYIDRKDNPFYIKFLNQKDWCKNIFQVSNQITMESKHKNRYDVTLLINGFPLVQIELKRRGMPLKEAFDQITRYTLHSYKGLFNYIQIFVVSNGINTKYFANGLKNDLQFEFTFYWKDEKNNNILSLDDFANTFLEKCNLAKMISKYMVLNESSKRLMILRAYQKYAVEAVIHQALDIKQNGYVWHTTGSGKTLTSYKVSQLLAEDESIYKVIFVVDRRDLDIQTNKEFNSFCDGCVNTTKHTGALIKNLTTEGKGKLVTTTIQKLSKAVKTAGDKVKLQKIKDKKIILIFDECHRSQFGEMHNVITEFFSNSLSFGFTGTPIFAKNSDGTRTTKDIFGKKLHEYVIKDAIADNNVLGFSVDYVGGAKSHTDIDKEVKKINTKEYLESDNRLNQIVDYIIESYDSKTRNREFNAMFTVSRGGVIHNYYELFKKKKHDLKIVTIFTFKANEDLSENEHSQDLLDKYILDYNKMFETNFTSDDFKQYHADVSKRMKNREIDLLLVVDMFLTGFDSKLLNTLYVDKNLQYHGLLQAFSRTNRIVNKRKSQGNIVCFTNLKDNVDEAIALFSDPNAIEDIILPPYETFVKWFNEDLKRLFKLVKTATEALDLQSENDKKKFVLIFRDLIRNKNKLDIFTEFNWDDVKIDEQEFNDFKSAYLDIYDEFKKDNEDGESVLGDIDFELELLRNDQINVDYILNLLADLDKNSTSFKHDKQRIISLMKEHENLRSKIDLIEKFINEKLGNIDSKVTNINEEFDKFMKHERKQAMCEIVDEENLNEDVARQIFEYFEFSGKIDEELIKQSLVEKLKFKERKAKVNTIKFKIFELFEKFDY
ncbi:type I restriction endonuclease subunit R, partial [Methanobrevibacter sp. A27]